MLNNINDLLLVAGQQEGGYEPYHETLEYISFDGTQMFWLPVKPALDVKIDITFKSDNYASTNCLFGGRINASGSNRKMFAFWQCVGGSSARPDDGYMRADLANSSTGSADIGKANSTSVWTNVVKDGKYNYLNGVLKATQSVTEEFYDDTNTYIVLGAMSNGTESNHSITNAFVGDVAQLKIWKTGVQIADYVPVLDSKMRPCLYDKVTKTFLYAKKISDGTETYDLGFKRWNKFDVDYIQSSGTQYINTDYKFTNTSAFEITCAEVGDFESSTVLCGARNNTDTTSNARIVDYSYSAPSVLRGEYLLLQRGGYDVSENVLYIPYDTEFHTYYQSPTRMSIDDTDRPTVPSLTSPNMDFYIFWQNVGTATAPAKAKIKVKNLKLWDNGTLVRDYKPVIWHNGDTTAEACLYDEVYNKMYQNAGTGSFKAYIERETTPYTLALHDNMDIQLGTGAYINGSGVVASDTASCYTKAIPVKQGDVITLTVTGRATTSVFNKRIHAYSADDGTIAVGQKGSWVSQLGYINYPIGQTNYTTQTLSVTIPSGVNYIRLSHALSTADDIILETQCDLTITRTYEVGTYIQTLKTSTSQSTGYMLDLDIEPKDGIGYHIKTSTNTNASNYVFGARKGTSIPSQQSNKPILVGLTGSQTGATILTSVMGASATWKSDNTNWVRPSSSTSSYVYECSMQTYKENNELKFNVIGYSYTLAKNADKQTLTYTDAIDDADEADMSTLHIGGLNVNNILNGNNAYFFIECRQPNTDMTLLPVVNNNQFYFIDNKTKQTYQFYKVGSPTPTTDNIRIKKLDGTFIDGSL